MERENRYLIIKRKDIAAYLTEAEVEVLDDISRKINRQRLMDGKSVLMAVVVEHDWPEYEPTWAAIEKRMDGEASLTHEQSFLRRQEGGFRPPYGKRNTDGDEARKSVCEHACKGIDTETLIHAGVVQRGELVDVLRRLDETRQLIADNGFACTFQSLGQYRTALLKSIDATTAVSRGADVTKEA